jgi:hypothetical protein
MCDRCCRVTLLADQWGFPSHVVRASEVGVTHLQSEDDHLFTPVQLRMWFQSSYRFLKAGHGTVGLLPVSFDDPFSIKFSRSDHISHDYCQFREQTLL